MNIVWSNGQLIPEDECRISPLDRGLTLGDGVFETIRANGARPVWLSEHLDRLTRSARAFGISLPYDRPTIESGIVNLLMATQFSESAVRLTLTRGRSDKRGLWPPSDPEGSNVIITAAPLPPFVPQRVIIALSTRRNEHSPLSRMKSLNYGDNLLAKREALERGATDAFMLNGMGNIACATVGNIFLKLGDHWNTPPASDGALPGLARARLMMVLEAKEVSVPKAALHEARVALISNSLGCSIVQELEGRTLHEFDVGPLQAIYH